MTKNNSSQILNRLKEALSIKSDRNLAQYLNLPCATIANWKARDCIDFKYLFSKLDTINFHWLITGKGDTAVSSSIYSKKLERIIFSVETYLQNNNANLNPLQKAIIITTLYSDLVNQNLTDSEIIIKINPLITLTTCDNIINKKRK